MGKLTDQALGGSDVNTGGKMSLVDRALSGEPQQDGKKYGIKRAVSYFTRPVLEYGGAILGGVAAVPASVVSAPTGVGPVVAETAGVGLGYLGGKKLADALDAYLGINKVFGEKDDTPGDILKKFFVKDIPEAGEVAMSGPVLGKTVAGAGKIISQSGVPEKLYAESVKAPLRKSWLKNMPGSDINKRQNAISKGLKENIALSEQAPQKTAYGMDKAYTEMDNEITRLAGEEMEKIRGILKTKKEAIDTINSINSLEETGISAKGFKNKKEAEDWLASYKSDRIKQAEKSAQDQIDFYESRIKTSRVVQDGTKDAYDMAKKFDHPDTAKAIIDDWVAKTLGQRGENLSVRKAQEFKQGLYSQSNYEATSASKNMRKQLIESARKGTAHQVMLELENVFPELKNLNKNYAAWRDINEVVTRAVGQAGNNDSWKIGTKILLTGGNIKLGVLDHLLGRPALSRIAIMIKNANKLTGKKASAATRAIAIEANQPDDQP